MKRYSCIIRTSGINIDVNFLEVELFTESISEITEVVFVGEQKIWKKDMPKGFMYSRGINAGSAETFLMKIWEL